MRRANPRIVAIAVVMAVAVVGVGAGYAVSVFGSDSGASTGQVVAAVAAIVLVVAVVAGMTWLVAVVLHARTADGPRLDVDRAERRQAMELLRRGVVAADPDMRMVAEREARRLARVSPVILCVYPIFIAAFVLFAVTGDTLARWFGGYMVLFFAVFIAYMAVWWRRSKRYLAALGASAE